MSIFVQALGSERLRHMKSVDDKMINEMNLYIPQLSAEIMSIVTKASIYPNQIRYTLDIQGEYKNTEHRLYCSKSRVETGVRKYYHEFITLQQSIIYITVENRSI